MISITQEELLLVKAGGISANLINYFVRVFNNIFEIGCAIGSSIRKMIKN